MISVITIVLNDSEHITNTIESVINQSYIEYEYIVIDGGSTDGTSDILKRYGSRINHLISEPDRGIYDAMNKGTKLSIGEWIIFLNSGDCFHDSNVLRSIFETNPEGIDNADVIYSDAVTSFGSEKKLRKARSLKFFWHGLPFSHQACIVRTSYVKERPFCTEYKICADYDFLYPLYLEGARFYYHNEPIAIVNIDGGISRNTSLRFLYKEFLSISKRHSSASKYALIYFVHLIEFCIVALRSSLKAITRYNS